MLYMCAKSLEMSLGDDPHFSVVLPSGQTLCYTVQGDHHRSYSLLSNRRMQMNAMFVPDSRQKEVTWIGSLGMVFRPFGYRRGSKDAVTTIRLEALGSLISINSRVNVTARNIDGISIKEGVVRICESAPFDGFRYPSVRIMLEDHGLKFSVMFKKEHLDLFWQNTALQGEDTHGLIGVCSTKGVLMGVWR